MVDKKSDNKDCKKEEDSLVEELKAKLIEMENNWKRALADYKNLQKRIEEEKDEIVNFSNAVLLSRLLPILDNLEVLKRHTSDEGLKLIIKEFKQVLMDAGVEAIDCINKDFDAATMEAVEVVEGEEGKVVKVSQSGYKLNGRVIRPARVSVGGKESSD